MVQSVRSSGFEVLRAASLSAQVLWDVVLRQLEVAADVSIKKAVGSLLKSRLISGVDKEN